MMIAPGCLIEFFQDKKLLCGLCLKTDKKAVHLLSEENREVSVPPTRVLLSAAGLMSAESLREDVVARLRREATRREDVRASIVLADLWELLCDEPGQYVVQELASTWFGNECDDGCVSGMLRALRDDRVYFERKNELYIPNGRERVTTLLETIRAEQNKERERDEIGRWLQAVWRRAGGGNGPGSLPIEAPECLGRYLEWFKDVAIQGAESGRHKEIHGLLQRAGIGQNDAPFQVLVRAGVWETDENLLLHKFHVPRKFPAGVIAEAEAVVAGAPSAWPQREDLTALDCVTIDDEHTVETDDGLTLQRLEGGWRVGIHIADPAEFLEPEGVLDREALHRGTSVYLPDLKIPMLPPVLGTGICSLVEGKDRPAMTVLADLDDEGTLLASRVVESVVRVRQRLTYDYVDGALTEGSREDLTTLHRLASARLERRRASGAIFVPFPSIEVQVTSDGSERCITVRREEHDIPSHVLVSEFMILANEVVAVFCRDHGIPAIYRSQPDPSEPIVIGETFTALDGFKIRRLLRKGGTGLDPARHAGLGIDAYLQFTSPIRRYGDLTMHRQIKHYLRTGSPFHDRAALEKITTVTSGPVEQAETLERQRKAYWIYRHLEESLWAERVATVLQVFPDRYHVQLTDTLVETDCAAVPGSGVTPGDVIPVKIELVWPREGVLRVTPLVAGSGGRGKG